MQCIKEFYYGIDLGASKTHLCLITEQDTRLISKRMYNGFYEIDSVLHPYKPSLKIVVESTIN